MKKVVTTAQMREMDRQAIEERGIPGVVLMENAGAAIVDVICDRFESISDLRVNIFAGKGNNGGDGFVVARLLSNLGALPTVFLVAEKSEIKGDARINLTAFEKMGGRIKEFTSTKHLKNFKLKFMHTTVVVDALFGTGASSAPRGFFVDVIETMNNQGRLKVAVDIPSGVMADSGQTPGVFFKANITVTFGAPKIGLLTYPGKSATGKLVIADISIPSEIYESVPSKTFYLEDSDVVKLLPHRSNSSHKGSFGHLAITGGSVGMGGAVALSSKAALRVGTGLVSIALPHSLSPPFEVGLPEVMTSPLPETESGAISEEAVGAFESFIEDKNAILIGPGMRTAPSTIAFVSAILKMSDLPMVIDADALNGIGANVELIQNRKAPTVITPHPGEMSRLTDITVSDIQNDRLNIAKNYAEKSGAVVVLKGAATIIATPEGEAYINGTGNHGLATAGTGDVLAGMISGFLAQGVEASDAAILGVYLHGAAGDEFCRSGADPRALIASDLIDLLPSLLGKFLPMEKES